LVKGASRRLIGGQAGRLVGGASRGQTGWLAIGSDADIQSEVESEGDAGRLADDASRRLIGKRGRRVGSRRKSQDGPSVAGRHNTRLELRVLHDETPETRRDLWRFRLTPQSAPDTPSARLSLDSSRLASLICLCTLIYLHYIPETVKIPDAVITRQDK